jgi:uncharacterized membrane protein YagU involved in acid resistance
MDPVNEHPSPLGAVARGVAAGVAGTAVMTAWQTAAAKLSPAGQASSSEDQARNPWDEASAPAQVARRILKGVFKRKVPASQIPLLTNVMHWGYGTSWGIVYGLVAGTTGRSRVPDGMLFGTAVWTMSYVQLVPMGLYELPWKYPSRVVALDVSYHLAYGIGVSSAYRLLP